MCKTLYLVIPCYNEEEVLLETARCLNIKMQSLIEKKLIGNNSKVVFVDDGSKDNTWNIITQLHLENALFSGISLSRNYGEQNAYLAGMMAAKEYADIVITMDADLQDDINAIDKMVAEHYKGSEIVYGVRASRKNEPYIKKMPAQAFYAMMKHMGTELIANHSQYRLMSRTALEALAAYPEVNMFLPALIPLLGFQSAVVFHERHERIAGKSKYSVRKLLFLAVEAVTSFSLKPLRLINILGGLCLLAAAVITVYAAISALQGNFSGWLAVLASAWAVGGSMLFSVGVVGEYVGKTYIEAKRRPRYFVSESLLNLADGSRSQPSGAGAADD